MAGVITLGTTTETGTITVGQSTAGQNINIGSGNNTSSQIIMLGNGNNAANSTIDISAGNPSAINILAGAGTVGTGAINLGDNPRVNAIDIGNVAPAATRTITIAGGNSAQNGTVNILAGAPSANTQTVNILSGVATGGTQTLNLGTGASAKTIIIGNTTGATALITRFGTGGNLVSQLAPPTNFTSSSTLTIANLLTRIITATPSGGAINLTLPTAANAVAGVSNEAVNDSIDFSVIDQSTTSGRTVTLLTNTGATLVGSMLIIANAAGTHSSSGLFRMRFTNITGGSEAYTLYRIA